MIIYKALNKLNGKVYIGQSINSLEYRKSQHYREAKSKNDNNYFHNALLKYSKEDFIWSVIAECKTQDELNILEIKYIDEYNSTNKDVGYNRKLGGEQGLCSQETKDLIGKHTAELWKDEETATKMKEGLRKGTETMKQKAEENYISFICPICGKELKIKPYDKRKTCSIECGTIYKNRELNKGLEKAKEVNSKNFDSIQEERKSKIIEWCNSNKEVFTDLKLNKLSFLEDLADYIGVSDIRTLTKVLGETSRKKFAVKLQELVIENVC